MTQKERYERMIAYFEQARPTAQTELHYKDPFQLLVAVILSAQCTDKRVNMTTPALFAAYPNAAVMAQATPEEVYEYIRSISYPHNKSCHLVGMAKKLMEDYGGEVPSDIDELQTLPGVGRKTANVLRVANRIGLTCNSKNPLQTERELVKHIPPEKIPIAHHWLILHGRYVCQARKPHCADCGISDLCKYFQHTSNAQRS